MRQALFGAVFLLGVAFFSVSSRSVQADGVQPADGSGLEHAHATAGPLGPVLEEAGPAELSTYYATGEQVELPTFWRHKFICGTDVSQLTDADLRQVIEMGRALEQAEGQAIVISPTLRGGGLNINFNVSGSPPQAALDALQRIVDFYSGLFDNPMTIAITFGWANLGGGVLGGTGSSYIAAPYSATRAGLINNMDEDDSVQFFLPEGTTIPVRYNASNDTITNTSTVNVTRANYRATVGTALGAVASMTINSSVSWDYDESNGVPGTAWAFESVVIHEVGHALGFTSAADTGTVTDLEMLDIFRFQNTDGANDRNPDTFDEFLIRPRTVDFNNLNDDANSDLITVQYRMSDGSPHQASHFREQNFPNIGLMDPAIANGQTFLSSGWLKTADRNVFDAIGWNYVVNTCTTPGDFDDDGDVDLVDLRLFQLCFDLVLPPAPGCECGNVAHEDNRVNLLDWEVFEKALITGP